jgi:hypothetical protein
MPTRFEMAEGLIAWARQRLEDLETDYYQKAARARHVTVELQIAIKEFLEHLRSALDYCARETHDRCVGVSVAPKVYFPIASQFANRADFPSVVNNCMRGLQNARPDLVDVLASFQAFASAENVWLPRFATLCNENKHEQLSVQRAVQARIDLVQANGSSSFKLQHDNKELLSRDAEVKLICHIMITGSGELERRRGVYFTFDAIDCEVLTFLRPLPDAVDHILRILKAVIPQRWLFT